MHLYKTIFVSTFGRGAKHTLQAALCRVGFLAITSISLGVMLSRLLPPLPPQSDGLLPLLCSSVFLTQIVVAATLFASYGIIRPHRYDTLARLLLYWPLTPHAAWIAILIPGLILSLFAISFTAPSLFILFAQLGVEEWTITAAILLGWVSALGIVYGLPRRPGWLQVGEVFVLLGLHYWLLQVIYSLPNNNVKALVAWCLLLLSALLLFIRSAHSLVSEASTERRTTKVWCRFMPARYWFVKKVWRGHVTRIGGITTILMSGITFLVLWRLSTVDMALVGMIAAVLSAALASDVRSLAKRSQPVEIMGLRGVLYFVMKQFTAITLTCLVATSPLLLVTFVLSNGVHFSDWINAFGLPMLLGIACGLFASTLTAPGERDITAQSGATLLAMGIFTLPQLSVFPQLAETTTSTISVTLLVALLAGAVFIEYKRNPFVWRKS